MESKGGRHVVVTGGGRGIGRAIAERLAADGATLTLLARDLEPRLRPWCPPLTLRLAHGVACADDPGGGLSFGQSRCRMLAVAVHALVDQPTASADAGIEVCLRALSDARVDPERPWLHAEG